MPMCPNCNSAVGNLASRCPLCGHLLTKAMPMGAPPPGAMPPGPAPPGQPPRPGYPPQYAPPQSGSSSKMLWIILAAVFGGLLLIGGSLIAMIMWVSMSVSDAQQATEKEMAHQELHDMEAEWERDMLDAERQMQRDVEAMQGMQPSVDIPDPAIPGDPSGIGSPTPPGFGRTWVVLSNFRLDPEAIGGNKFLVDYRVVSGTPINTKWVIENANGTKFETDVHMLHSGTLRGRALTGINAVGNDPNIKTYLVEKSLFPDPPTGPPNFGPSRRPGGPRRPPSFGGRQQRKISGVLSLGQKGESTKTPQTDLSDLPAETKKGMDLSFQTMDKNGDGKLTPDENVLNMPPEQFRDLVEVFDTDGDGALNQTEWFAAFAPPR